MKTQDLQETARLAHLPMDEQELAGAFPEFERMLGFFAAMEAADGDGTAFSRPIVDLSRTSPSADSGNFRPDNSNNNTNNNSSNGLNETLINNAGERNGRFIVVPNVL
ncbi:Asp-tRNA(Asn)/Glu-tRNA(Gln) amidotransferase subunit GatC [Breznakiella homolactica]|uniref:Glutamyl-tRNA(Gln) amidotransferase subunit C n=1 Tax=Breznakiella homolactica TaxID=2798577 RepID=A0A7T7XR08_9SPIR|nr:aspartyl/glutamyl-tRNA amidotransferase subunit C [Breznakiella homolactica]QQO10905.1 aspartyl/glutamyl-tRNA amidotransferase subunit C [Breznakiella homolactica]